MELRGPSVWVCPNPRGVPGIRGQSRCSWGDLYFGNAPVQGHYVFISIVLLNCMPSFFIQSMSCTFPPSSWFELIISLHSIWIMVLQFKLPPKQYPFFLCIPFKLRECNLSFLWNCICTFFASCSNYWHAITSFLLNYIHPFFAYPLIFSLHPMQIMDRQFLFPP